MMTTSNDVRHEHWKGDPVQGGASHGVSQKDGRVGVKAALGDDRQGPVLQLGAPRIRLRWVVVGEPEVAKVDSRQVTHQWCHVLKHGSLVLASAISGALNAAAAPARRLAKPLQPR